MLGRLGGDAGPLDPVLLDRHFLRKHGAGATYGQPEGGTR